MRTLTDLRNGLAPFVLAAALAACGASDEGRGQTQASGVSCVPLPDGMYEFKRGVFTPVNPAVVNMTETVEAPAAPETGVQGSTNASAVSETDLANRVAAQFPDMGYDWLGLNVRRRIATLTGTAPNEAQKNAAFAAGRAALLGDPAAGDAIDVVVDGIAIEGGGQALGAALLALGDNPTLDACQAAFVDTMENRNVEFRTGSAVIQPESARLLEATTGVAILCDAYRIKIGGHTDDIGEDSDNLTLSQNRAEAVRTFLVERGVTADGVTAVGYGETRPIDNAGTSAARARNRRTEFTVTNR